MIYPWIESTGCCSLVLENLESTVSYWEQAGVLRRAKQPEEANLLIVGGWINPVQSEHLKSIYQKMCGDKQVMAVGSCAISGSVFSDLESVSKLSDVLPVHYNVTGCSPRWDDILKGITRVSHTGEKEKTVKEILNETGSDVVF